MQSSRRYVVGALVALAVATAALSGCNPTPGASPSPTTSSSHTRPSPSPSPTRPAAADRTDIEGAIAAAQHFLELYPYAYNTGDLDTWKAMSHPECIFCKSVIENVEELHAAGGYQTGGSITWVRTTAQALGASGAFTVDAVARQEPTEEVVGGAFSTVSEGGEALVYVDLDLTADGGWLVRGVDVEDASP